MGQKSIYQKNIYIYYIYDFVCLFFPVLFKKILIYLIFSLSNLWPLIATIGFWEMKMTCDSHTTRNDIEMICKSL